MPYIFKPVYGTYKSQMDDLRNGKPFNPSDTSSASTPMGSNPGQPMHNPSPQQSGTSGFVDIGSYLNANKEATQNFANNIGQQVANEGQKLKSDIDTASSDYQKQVNSGTVNLNQDLMTKLSTDPTQIVNNQSSLDEFKKMRDASYTGPTNFNQNGNLSDLQTRITQYTPKTTAPTASQMQEVIKQYSPNATKGSLNLDQMLLTQDPTAWNKYTELAKPYSTLNDYLDSIGKQNEDYTKKAQDTTAKTKEDTGKGLNTAIDNYKNFIEGRLTDYKNSATNWDKYVKDNINLFENHPALSDSDVKNLTSGNMNEAYRIANNLNKDYGINFDFKPYIETTSPETAINYENIVGPDNYYKESALEQLSNSVLPYTDLKDISQANTATDKLTGVPDIENTIANYQMGKDLDFMSKMPSQLSGDVSKPSSNYAVPDTVYKYLAQILNEGKLTSKDLNDVKNFWGNTWTNSEKVGDILGRMNYYNKITNPTYKKWVDSYNSYLDAMKNLKSDGSFNI